MCQWAWIYGVIKKSKGERKKERKKEEPKKSWLNYLQWNVHNGKLFHMKLPCKCIFLDFITDFAQCSIHKISIACHGRFLVFTCTFYTWLATIALIKVNSLLLSVVSIPYKMIEINFLIFCTSFIVFCSILMEFTFYMAVFTIVSLVAQFQGWILVHYHTHNTWKVVCTGRPMYKI